jgi:Zn-dependent protease with chaperone function
VSNVDPGLGAAEDGSGPSLLFPAALDPVISTGFFEPMLTTVSGSATSAGPPCLSISTHLGFNPSKSQIWLLEWIKDQLKINEEVRMKIIWSS